MDPLRLEGLAGRDLLSLADLSREEFAGLLDSAVTLKQNWKRGVRPPYLAQRTLAMIFEKPSLRTRTTFDIAMYQLGGHAVLLDQASIGLGVRETVRDVATNLSRWVDAIMARTHAHATLTQLAEHASVPVVNGLSDLLHPTQAVADYITLRERFGDLQGLELVYVGDGNNICNSHVNAAALAGVALTVACPPGYEPDAALLAAARARGACVEVVHDPREAARGADALYTDVWVSMGMEEESERRRRDFAGYTITPAWLEELSPRGVFMHDLPAHYGEECTEEAVYHERSVVFDQAENRLHAHKAILFQLLAAEAA
ncbi:MAG: ornithine carbamoyltransferase [Deinococcales bacterium]|nr:ornithine carbamoyltransferase [Deinococcales bacterium]